ncbi:MAG: hypothetical protein WC451_01320 [Patescibacteria group bacterium]|jgi:hypothetical protein
MRKSKFKQVLNFTSKILIELSRFGDEVVYPLTLSGMRQNLYYKNFKQFDNHIRSMERSGYISLNRKSNSVRLTNKGKIKIMEESDDTSIDGKWRMLSFDIPENIRVKRDQFRRSIKRVGYKQVQKSLWACPYVRADKIDLIIRELGIKEYVAYLRVDKTDIENHLESLFKKDSKQ